MNILISQRHSLNSHGQWCDSLESDYVRYFAAFGMTLFPVPNDTGCLGAMLQTVRPSGIILSGGGDVSPAFYGSELTEKAHVSLLREQTEAQLLDYCLKHRIPVLGICRGLQFINVYFKGTLISDINQLVPAKCHPCPGNHPVSLLHNDLVALTRAADSIDVNSYHHQGVALGGLAQELQAFAVERDLGLVEGLYHPHHRLAAVQWHPERAAETTPLDRIIVEAFRDGTLFWR